MSRKLFRSILAVSILLLTIGLFVYYIDKHPETIRQLRRLPLGTVGLLLGLYSIFLVALAWIQRTTLSLCDISLGRKESLLLIMYSSIINFFGPLQSGPAFRAAYLKRRHNVSLKNYTLATLLYYGFYALFSGMFLLTYFIGLWALGLIVIIVAASPLALRDKRLMRLVPTRFRSLQLQHIGSMAAGTLLQVAVLSIIFFVELGSFGRAISYIPALIYTGAANFALFVSITPGAIGFRESFVLFAQHLHHIPSSQIVSASLIDRGIYILFLGILVVITALLHGKQFLGAKTSKTDASSDTASDI